MMGLGRLHICILRLLGISGEELRYAGIFRVLRDPHNQNGSHERQSEVLVRSVFPTFYCYVCHKIAKPQVHR